MSTEDNESRWSDETEVLAAQAIGTAGASVTDRFSAAKRVLAALADARLLLPPDAIGRVERGEVYQDGHRIGLEAVRTVWETPWTPAPIPKWVRELLEGAEEQS